MITIEPLERPEYNELLYITRHSGVSTHQPLPWLGLRGRSNTDVSMSWDVVKSQGVFRVLGLAGRSCEEPARIDIDSMTSEMLVIHRCCSDDELRSVRRAVYCGCVFSQPLWYSFWGHFDFCNTALMKDILSHIVLATKKDSWLTGLVFLRCCQAPIVIFQGHSPGQ